MAVFGSICLAGFNQSAATSMIHTDVAWHGLLHTVCGCTRSQGALARCSAQGFVHKPASVRVRAATLLSCLAFLGRDLGTARRWADAALDADASCPAALVNKVCAQTLPAHPRSSDHQMAHISEPGHAMDVGQCVLC